MRSTLIMGDALKWFGNTMTSGGVGIWSLVGLVIVALIRQRPIVQKLTQEREKDLLSERAAEMNRMRIRIAELEAEQRHDRHALANMEQVINFLFYTMEANPDRTAPAVQKAKEMWERMKVEQAAEKGQILAAKISNADRGDEM